MGTERSRLGVDLPPKLLPPPRDWLLPCPPTVSPMGARLALGTHLCSISLGLSACGGSWAACSTSSVCSITFRL